MASIIILKIVFYISLIQNIFASEIGSYNDKIEFGVNSTNFDIFKRGYNHGSTLNQLFNDAINSDTFKTLTYYPSR